MMLSPAAQLLQGLAFFGLTFASEDAALFGAAALVGTRNLHWSVAFASVFLGMWMGDIALYSLSRHYGKAFLKRFTSAERLARGEAWFARSGWTALWLSRFVPGLRLPTLVAAGLLRAHAGAVGVITAVAGLLWVGAVIGGAAWLSRSQVMHLAKWLHDAWWVVALVLGAALLSPWLGHHHDGKGPCIWCRVTVFTQRLWQWEFWPAWLFYAPVGLYYAWLGLRFRGLGLPAIANPGLSHGGLVGESKHETLRLLRLAAPEQNADGWLLPTGDLDGRVREFDELCVTHSLVYPLVLKPDVGQRGAGVRVIRHREAAIAYLAAMPSAILLQIYAPGPQEIGVFYYRLPHEVRGRIFAITRKIFPTIIGDGRRTLAEIILADPRARLIADTYLQRFATRRDEVLAVGERCQLVEAGNHAQGCIFEDGISLKTPALESLVDEISQRIPGFFIGRYDIRFATEEDLGAGRFSVVELNGSGAEATSIYDARNSLLAAYRTLFQQWRLVFQIGAAQRAAGVSQPTVASLFRAWRENSTLVATYPIAD